MKALNKYIKESLFDLDDSTDIVAHLTSSLAGLKKIGPNDIGNIPDVESINVFMIPDGVREITPGTFEVLSLGGANIEVLILPPSLKVIGKYAFHGLRHLKEVRWSGNPSKCIFRDHAFAGCGSLEVIEIPEGVVELGESMFSWCKSLREISLPSSITKVYDSIFDWCLNLEKADLSRCNFSLLPENTFYKCDSLKEVVLPRACISIGRKAFDTCEKLRVVKAPNVKTLNAGCFRECSSLEVFDTDEPYINLGNVGSSDAGQFKFCTKLKELKPILKGVPERAFYGCKSLEEVRWVNDDPSYGNGIDYRAFYGCKSLKRLYVPVGTSEEWLRKQLESSEVEPEIIYDEKLK